MKESQLLHQDQQHRFTTLPLCKFKYSGSTQVINGLFCLFADNHAWVCSITTRETRELPYFGFVPSCNEYKLLKVCRMECHLQQGCMILTLGKDPSSSSYDDPVLPIYMAGDEVYIDGTIYCRSGISYCSSDLIAFSFQDETFQVIPSQPKASNLLDESSLVLLQCRGHLAMAEEKKRSYHLVVRGLFDSKLELWVLEQSTPSSYEWVYQVIDIPHDFPVGGFRLLGNLPLTGEMLLSGFAIDKSVVPVYSYDHTTWKFENFVIGKFPSPPCPSAASVRKDTNMMHIYYYEEDITPLNDLIPIVEKKKQKNKKGSRPATLNAYRLGSFPLGFSFLSNEYSTVCAICFMRHSICTIE